MGTVAFTGCKKDDDNATPTTSNLQAAINGQQEVPAVTSPGSGNFTGTYDKNTHKLTYNVTYQGITPSAGHIHAAAPGANGPVVVPFSSIASPITGTATLSEADAAELMAGHFYVNFHTSDNPSGEIRGNITVK
ncbi:CHRD domain-containing protein [Hymenobacter sp. BT730]|uniref:CHRD domain-containing protein n=1 Tax=Hymenobacter sp. BT730 TaxID=3063332 RepID=UPI0026E0F36B|nr:CHRD domain-containing protein [Hymenobacter sp. BT730]